MYMHIFKENQLDPDNNRDDALRALELEPQTFQHFCYSLQDDVEVALAAVSRNGHQLKEASDRLRADRQVVMAAVAAPEGGEALKFVLKPLKGDRDIVLHAVRHHGDALEFAPPELQADPEVVLTAISQRGTALRYASSKLKSDRKVVLQAVSNWGDVLCSASEKLCADREVVLAAVTSMGIALEYASEKLQADREVVLRALTDDGRALTFASERLQADEEVVLFAIKQAGLAERIANMLWDSEGLRSYHPIFAAAESFRSDPSFAQKAMALDWKSLMGFSDEIQRDPDMVLACLRHSGGQGWTSWFVEDQFKNDTFRAIVESKLATEGDESAPLATVTKISSTGDGQITGSALFLSGRSCDFHLKPEAVVDDVASYLVNHPLEDMKSFPRVRLIIGSDVNNGKDAEVVTPWDWNRPLKQYL